MSILHDLDALLFAYKHGKHDQSSHGRKGRAGKAGASAYAAARAGGASHQDALGAAKQATVAERAAIRAETQQKHTDRLTSQAAHARQVAAGNEVTPAQAARLLAKADRLEARARGEKVGPKVTPAKPVNAPVSNMLASQDYARQINNARVAELEATTQDAKNRAKADRLRIENEAIQQSQSTRMPVPDIRASSEKQRDFAQRERDRVLRNVERFRLQRINEYQRNPVANADQRIANIDAAINALRNNVDARFWIDAGSSINTPESILRKSLPTTTKTLHPLIADLDRICRKAQSDSHTPPADVQAAARRALERRAESSPSARGMTPVGLARARDLSNGRPVSRHQSDKQGATWDDYGPGRQAWDGWGGDAGWTWARGVVARADAATKAVTLKHGKHDQSSHGRKGAGGQASARAYSAVRASGGSIADARSSARDANSIYRNRQRVADIDQQLSGATTDKTRASLQAERDRLTKDTATRVDRLRASGSQAMSAGVGGALYQAQNAPVTPRVRGRADTAAAQQAQQQATARDQARQASVSLAAQHGLPEGASKFLEMTGNDPQIAALAGRLQTLNARLPKSKRLFDVDSEAGAVANAQGIMKNYGGSLEAAAADAKLRPSDAFQRMLAAEQKSSPKPRAPKAEAAAPVPGTKPRTTSAERAATMSRTAQTMRDEANAPGTTPAARQRLLDSADRLDAKADKERAKDAPKVEPAKPVTGTKPETPAQVAKRLNAEIAEYKPVTYDGVKIIGVGAAGDTSQYGGHTTQAIIAQRGAGKYNKAEEGYTVYLPKKHDTARATSLDRGTAVANGLTMQEARAVSALIVRHRKPGMTDQQVQDAVVADPDFAPIRAMRQARREAEATTTTKTRRNRKWGKNR
jgi:hypothetical protein